jgi:hypothetical protein
MKVIIYMNFNLLFLVFNQSIAKYSTTELGLKVVDLCFFRVFIQSVFFYILATSRGKNVITDIPEDLRKYVFARAFFGALWLMTLS